MKMHWLALAVAVTVAVVAVRSQSEVVVAVSCNGPVLSERSVADDARVMSLCSGCGEGC